MNDIRNYAENQIFGSLAFGRLLTNSQIQNVQLDEDFADFKVTVNASSTYVIQFYINKNIDLGSWFKVELPFGWSKTVGVDNNCSLYHGNVNIPEI